VSGYTFAFGDEPDLDRLIYLQQPTTFETRSYAPDINVSVFSAFSQEDGKRTQIDQLIGARVNLLDKPMLQNRNWVLTLPGQEPIDPFKLEITAKDIRLYRHAPIDPNNPDKPIWDIDQELIKKHGARGMEYEPETIGNATGIWDSLAVAKKRKEDLEIDLAKLKADNPNALAAISILEGRIWQLNIGITLKMNRRTAARSFVERFGFPMLGAAQIDGDQQKILGGSLAVEKKTPWTINFWIGGWDPDLLCAYMQGSLDIPYQELK
jgi:hypothetical protein